MMEIREQDGHRIVDLGDGPNAVDQAFLDGLNGALDRVEADEAATTLITVGGGKHYSNGFDLEFLGSLAQADALAFLDLTATTLARVLTFPLPTAAALNGHAFGAGAMLALAHDVRVQNEERGWFCFPEVDLGMQFMPFQLELVTGRMRADTAEEAILTGRRYDGAAAVAAGIAQASAAPEALVATAAEALAPRTGKARAHLAGLKRQLNRHALALLPEPPA
jgi:enoyl-CoA hydratase/carnithine racemase